MNTQSNGDAREMLAQDRAIATAAVMGGVMSFDTGQVRLRLVNR